MYHNFNIYLGGVSILENQINTREKTNPVHLDNKTLFFLSDIS